MNILESSPPLIISIAPAHNIANYHITWQDLFTDTGLCQVILRRLPVKMNPPPPERNIEIKARISNEEDFQRKVEIARNLTSTQGEIISQKDVFFHSKTGRLKLRYPQEGKAQLIQYDRPDLPGPRLSRFNRIDIDQPEILEEILNQSNGSLGVLRKSRIVFHHNNVRIHLDRVQNLGVFIEFEVNLSVDQTEEEGQRIMGEMINLFGIRNEELLAHSYFDELRRTISLDQD